MGRGRWAVDKEISESLREGPKFLQHQLPEQVHHHTYLWHLVLFPGGPRGWGGRQSCIGGEFLYVTEVKLVSIQIR